MTQLEFSRGGRCEYVVEGLRVRIRDLDGGLSVTNGIEEVCSRILRDEGLSPPQHVQWETTDSYGDVALVTFTRFAKDIGFTDPTWRHVRCP